MIRPIHVPGQTPRYQQLAGNGCCTATGTFVSSRLRDFVGSLKQPQLRLTPLVWFVLLVTICGASGCSTQRFLTMRSMPLNPLTTQLNLTSQKGPEVSSRTLGLLRKYDLLDLYKSDARECLNQVQHLAESEPESEIVYSISELAYILGKRFERQRKNPEALDMYSVAVSNAYMYLFSPRLDPIRNPYDPRFRGACDLYNESLESTLRLVKLRGELIPGKSYRLTTGQQNYEVATVVRGPWQKEDFERIEFCSDFEVEGLPNPNVTYGLGVPLVAVRKRSDGSNPAERYYPNGLSFAVTALLRVVDPGTLAGGRPNHRYHCVLELHDPLHSCNIELAERLVPLQTDLGTPLAFFLDSPQFREQADSTLGFIDPNRTQHNRGIYMLEPYDPDRIPVLMVHGLLSSPVTWMPMFNDLRSFQELRRNYQFWFYQYPTGQPFWVSATQLRADLQQLRQTIDPNRANPALDAMVLVGHSMGGLVSRLQTVESGDEFWRILSDHPFEDVQADPETRKKLASALFFEPNRSIRRVITIGTPHRGSDYANDYTRWLSRKLITLPSSLVDTGHTLVRQNPGLFRDTDLLTTNTSVDSLSPSSPVFPALIRAQRAPWVRYHNIIGLSPADGWITQFDGDSDGVVDLESARIDGVDSEIIVESDHQNIHRTPKAILEVRRILADHLQEMVAELSVAYSQQAPAQPTPLPPVQTSQNRMNSRPVQR